MLMSVTLFYILDANTMGSGSPDPPKETVWDAFMVMKHVLVLSPTHPANTS